MAGDYPSLLQCAVVAGAFKVLLFPAYKSTDFEVHRNWLAITNSLPLRQWYLEDTSEWTLDYPPFFAYFEYLLSWPLRLIDPKALNVKNLNYDGWPIVYYQRATVILSESLLLYSLLLFVRSSPASAKQAAQVTALSVFLSPGLLIIDHVHFQYNGFLYGLLILSLVFARKRSTLLLSALAFAALLCLKHIYLYLAPAFFVFLLRTYCLSPRSIFDVRIRNTVQLGVTVVVVFTIAFAPFLSFGQMDQLLRRLFPFSRGLCHAYWAPNVWSLYSFADRVLVHVGPFLRIKVDQQAINSVTRGLVGDTAFAVLPDITPRTTFLLTIGAQLTCLTKLFQKPSWDNFIGAVILCGYASFLFGWHVHEKAILLVIIPFSLLAIKDRRHLGAFRPLAVAGHVSLFPLLFTTPEFPIKAVYTVAWLILFLYVFDQVAPASKQPRVFLLDRFSVVYTAIAVPLILYCSVVHGIIFRERFEFIPLMFTSAYSALGVIGSWLGFSIIYFTS